MKSNCTAVGPTCPADGSSLTYPPSLIASIIFGALFAISLVCHFALGLKYKTWVFMSVYCTASLLEVIGYIGRILVRNNPYDLNSLDLPPAMYWPHADSTPDSSFRSSPLHWHLLSIRPDFTFASPECTFAALLITVHANLQQCYRIWRRTLPPQNYPLHPFLHWLRLHLADFTRRGWWCRCICSRRL